MSNLFEQCARLFMVGFPGPALDREFTALIGEGVFGAIFFKRNVGGVEETSELCRAAKAAAGRPFLLAVDHEGGRVARLRGAPFAALPPMRQLAAGGADAARAAGTLLAKEVRAVGFDWNFAPVLDVDTNPANPVIGDRAFSNDPRRVAELGVALATAMEAAGVASCAKHFPGHGDTVQDSHHALPRLPHGLSRLRALELVPFAAYARAKLASVMTAHVVFEALEAERPATLSRLALGVLRDELGFSGVIVSDDLEMKAIADHVGVERAVVEGVRAGVDLFLVCHRADVQRAAIEALVGAVELGDVTLERLRQSHARLDSLEEKFFQHPGGADRDWLGSEEHRRLRESLQLPRTPLGADPTEQSGQA